MGIPGMIGKTTASVEKQLGCGQQEDRSIWESCRPDEACRLPAQREMQG